MKKVFILILAIILTLSVLGEPAYCGQDNPATKLGRGLANLFTGWLEIPAEIGRQLRKKGEVAATFVGPVLGLCKAVGRTAVGVYETVTFPFPVPPGYKSVLEQEFVMQSQSLE